MKLNTYLGLFYSFCIAIFSYFLLVGFVIKSLPLIDYSKAINELLPYYQPYTYPQRDKIVAYIMAITLIPTLTSLYYLSGKIFFLKFNIKMASVTISILSVLSFSLVLFAFTITLFKSFLIVQGLEYVFSPDPFIYSRVFISLVMVGVLIASIIYFSSLLRKIPKINFPLTLIIIMMIVVTLFDRTFSEKDLFLEKIHQYQHTSVFIEPIYDIMKGRVILVNSDSQYGIFINYIPAIIFKLFPPLTFTRFLYLMMIYGVVYYIVAYFLLLKRFQNQIYAILGLIVLFSLHFYPALDRYTRPMMFPIRTILDLPFFLLILFVPLRKLSTQILVCLYLALAIFYNYETGLSLAFAYLLTHLLHNYGEKIIQTAHALFLFLLWIVVIGSIYSLYAKYISGSFPNWPNTFFYFRIFSQGLASGLNFPIIGLHLIPLTIYLIFIIRTVVKLFEGKNISAYFWETCLALYGLAIFSYYLSRFYILNLPVVSIPAIILSLILLRNIYQVPHESKFTLFSPYLILSTIVVFSIIYHSYRLSTIYKYDYWKGNHEESAKLYNDLTIAAAAFDKYEPNKKEAAVVSYFDTFVSLKANRLNSLPYNSVQNMITKTQLETILSYLDKTKPAFIYTDRDPQLETNLYQAVFAYIRKYYQIIDSIGYLDVWRYKTESQSN